MYNRIYSMYESSEVMPEGTMYLKDVVIPVKIILNCEDTISHVIDEFCNNGITEAPVVKEDGQMGIISIFDLYDYIKRSKNIEQTISHLYNKENISIRVNDSLENIEKISFDTALVYGEDDALVGLIRKSDIMMVKLCRTSGKAAANKNKIAGFKSNFLISHMGKEIMDFMNDGIYITDNKGVTLYVNEAYTQVSGINSSELVGREMSELIRAGYFEDSASLKVLKTHRPFSIIDRYKNGRTCLATSSPVFDENGNIIIVVTNLRDMTELLNLKTKVEETSRLNREYLNELEKFKNENSNHRIIGESKQIKDIHDTISYISNVDTTILIQGETGVGKEIFAKEIHEKSARRHKKFIKVNCAAIPENLFESELFGYEKGAFTGAANTGKAGFFEVADGGTILLDEIAEIPVNIQPKLLRVLQEKQIMRVGATSPIDIDVRIIAATNRELWKQVKKGEFREDLFYRLNIVPITIPPLRERKEDIRLLSVHFLETYNNKYGKNKELTGSALNLLESMELKGNVRQLKNIIERIVLVCTEPYIADVDILKLIENKEAEIFYRTGERITGENMTLNDAVSVLEESLVRNALNKYKTTRKAAAALGVSQPSVVRKAKRYGITIADK